MSRSKALTEQSILGDALEYPSTEEWKMESVSYQPEKMMGIAIRIAARAGRIRSEASKEKPRHGTGKSFVEQVKWKANGLPKHCVPRSGPVLYYERRIPSRHREVSGGRHQHWRLSLHTRIGEDKDVIAVAVLEAERLFLQHCDLWEQELQKKTALKSDSEALRRKADPFVGLKLNNLSERHIYIMSNPSLPGGWIKIGESVCVDRRVKEFNTAAPKDFVVDFSFPLPEGKSDKDAHVALRGAAKESNREWFLIPVKSAKRIIFEEIYQDDALEQTQGWHLFSSHAPEVLNFA
jgi:hypothetical protein